MSRSLGIVLEFDIPVQVVAPGLGRVAESYGEVQHRGHPFGFPGVADEPHSGFLRRAPPLPVVALETARDDIVPGFAAPSDDRNHVIKRQILTGTFFPAVLAGMMIAGVNIRPVEFHALKALMDFYIFQEPEDAGHFDGEADASDLAIVFGKNFDLALAEQTESSLPGNNVDWLVSSV